MALSGTLNTTAYSSRYIKLSWSATQSISGNKSTISWQISGEGGQASKWYMCAPVVVKINGTTVCNITTRFQLRGDSAVIRRGTIDIAHNADGTKNFAASIEAAIYSGSVNCTGSNTFTLNQIPRQATITGAENFNDTGNPKITYSNLAGNSVDALAACISFDNSTANIAYRSISKTGTTYTFNLTEAERNTLRNYFKNSKTGTVYFYVRTTIANVNYYSKLAKTVTIDGAPTVTLTAQDVNAASIALTGDSNKIVKNLSTIQYAATATAAKYATISGYSVINGGSNRTTATGTFPSATSNIVTATVTDSRGYTARASVEKTLIDYIPLTAVVTVNMPTTQNTCKVDISGNLWHNGNFGAVINKLGIKYRVKSGEGDYSSWQNIVTDSVASSGELSIQDNKFTYSVEFSNIAYNLGHTFDFQVYDKAINITKSDIYVKCEPIFDFGQDSFNLNVPLTYKERKMVIMPEDEIESNLIYGYGFVSNAKRSIFICVPFNKIILADNVTVSGNAHCRSSNGYINGTTYSNSAIDLEGTNNYTVTSQIVENGVFIRIDFNADIVNAVNNDNISFSAANEDTITFVFS